MSFNNHTEWLQYEIDLITEALTIPADERRAWFEQRQAEHPLTGKWDKHAIISTLLAEAHMRGPAEFERYLRGVREENRARLELL